MQVEGLATACLRSCDLRALGTRTAEPTCSHFRSTWRSARTSFVRVVARRSTGHAGQHAREHGQGRTELCRSPAASARVRRGAAFSDTDLAYRAMQGESNIRSCHGACKAQIIRVCGKRDGAVLETPSSGRGGTEHDVLSARAAEREPARSRACNPSPPRAGGQRTALPRSMKSTSTHASRQQPPSHGLFATNAVHQSRCLHASSCAGHSGPVGAASPSRWRVHAADLRDKRRRSRVPW